MSEKEEVRPGIYQMSADTYHADPCPIPSLSASIAHILCSQSPLHAWTAHPRLNPNYIREEATRMDIGSIVHALVLEGENKACVLDFPDRRTNAYKQAHAAAMAAGEIPVLRKDFEDIKGMVVSLRQHLDKHRKLQTALMEGRPEVTLIWKEDNGVVCRARPDWLSDDHRRIEDYKTRSGTANPEVVSRTIFTEGWDIQAAFYIRGLKALDPRAEPMFRFVLQETYPPYAVSVVALGPDSLMLADKKVLWAIDTWKRCLDANEWPSYPGEVCYATLPAWEEARWLERELA
jgi:PDDEXK-like uncharacterized protein DUF3799